MDLIILMAIILLVAIKVAKIQSDWLLLEDDVKDVVEKQ
jgi:hypothetical protein